MKVINLYGNIGYDWWTGEGITSKAFIRDFDAALASGEDIEIRINSPGGSVFEGIAIYNKIAAHSDKVTTVVDGIAYSMGAVIAMAAKNRKAMKNATIMIHNVSGSAYGNAKDLRGALEMMERLDNSLIESIAQFTGNDSADIKAKYFDYQDHTLSAQEALDAKLLTEVIDLNAENVPSNLSAMSVNELFAYYSAQHGGDKKEGFLAKIINSMRSNTPANPPAGAPTPIENSDSDMTIKIAKGMTALVAALSISFGENETEKDVELTAQHITAINAALEQSNQKLTDATNKVTDLTNQVTAKDAEIKRLGDVAAGSQNFGGAGAAQNNAGGEGAGDKKDPNAEIMSDVDASVKKMREEIYGKEDVK